MHKHNYNTPKLAHSRACMWTL